MEVSIMHKSAMWLVVAMVVVAMVLAGCVPAAAPPAPAPAPAPAVSELPGWGPMQGVAVKPDGTPYTFVFADPFVTEPMHIAGVGIFESLIARAGGESIVLDAHSDAYKHICNLEDAMSLHPDGIIGVCVDGYSEVTVVESIYDAGIPYVQCMNTVSTDKIVAQIYDDFYQHGKIQGEFIEELQRGRDIDINVYVVRGYVACIPDIDRFGGIRSVIELNPRINIIESPSCWWMDDAAADAVSDAFLTHPELNAVIETGSMAPGVVEGLKLAHRFYPVGHAEHVIVVAEDENKPTWELLKDGSIDAIASHNAWESVDMSVKTLLNYVCLGKEPPEKDVKFAGYLITMEEGFTPRFCAPHMVGDMPAGDFDSWPILCTEELGIETPTLKK